MNELNTTCSSNELLIIGRGRLAKHLSAYLDYLKINFYSWNRDQDLNALNEKINLCTHVAIAIKDSEIEKFYLSHPELKEKTCLHFSGSQEIDGILGFHPLMSFGSELYDLNFYQQIPFVGTSEVSAFKKAFPFFQNNYYQIPAEKKAFYHCLCVLGGNFTAILWNKFFQEMQNLGLQKKDLAPYLKRINENILIDSEKAITGPLVRGDQETIEKNLKSLKNDPFEKMYQAFVEMYSI